MGVVSLLPVCLLVFDGLCTFSTDRLGALAGDVVSLRTNAKSEDWCTCQLEMLGDKGGVRLVQAPDGKPVKKTR